MWSGRIEDCILHEEKEFLVCHKPSGIAVQNARIGVMDMESALKNYLAQKMQGKMPYLAVVHRLDQPVEGILVFAKTPKAAANLSKQMSAGEMGKYYFAVTEHAPEKDEAVLEDYLKKDGRNNLSAVVKKDTAGAKKAILKYKLLDTVMVGEKKRYLLEIQLETGRHHQIRVQMSHNKMPLLGDRKYNSEAMTGVSMGLCSMKLFFAHPFSGKRMEFQTLPMGNAFDGFEYLKNLTSKE